MGSMDGQRRKSTRMFYSFSSKSCIAMCVSAMMGGTWRCRGRNSQTSWSRFCNEYPFGNIWTIRIECRDMNVCHNQAMNSLIFCVETAIHAKYHQMVNNVNTEFIHKNQTIPFMSRPAKVSPFFFVFFFFEPSPSILLNIFIIIQQQFWITRLQLLNFAIYQWEKKRIATAFQRRIDDPWWIYGEDEETKA